MSRRRKLRNVLFGMEKDVRALIAWADTVFELGTSTNDPSACLLVVAPAMREAAVRIERDWERAFELVRYEGGGAK